MGDVPKKRGKYDICHLEGGGKGGGGGFSPAIRLFLTKENKCFLSTKLVNVVTVADVDDEDRDSNSLLQIWKLRFDHKT